jgi:hypothetical protein
LAISLHSAEPNASDLKVMIAQRFEAASKKLKTGAPGLFGDNSGERTLHAKRSSKLSESISRLSMMARDAAPLAPLLTMRRTDARRWRTANLCARSGPDPLAA